VDDVEDLFPQRRPAAADPTLSADGLDGLFEEQPDSTLAVDTVGELFESPAATRTDALEPTPITTSAAKLSVDDDLLDEVEQMFEATDAVESLDAAPSATTPASDSSLLEAAASIDGPQDGDRTHLADSVSPLRDSTSDAPIGELVASLADELQKIEAALRDSDDDPAA
jgi:hypothetical protein